ncbi:hypothetical protein A9179_19670 [Pseudomonas alcaligenes]|uniref:Uncharacterized protein n=1 Tax=Aquipseudomonas alcaligenes TaxID=43263 RepID=A0ABR7S5T0_AQUAC|nr:hypothetical protein [Pseudomonas alcaligenes]MBC9252489.1 hypothetical protein [Pseudomonas alcaligenes]
MDTFKPPFDPRYQLEAEEPEAAGKLPARRLIHDDICLALQRLDGLSGRLREPEPPAARH